MYYPRIIARAVGKKIVFTLAYQHQVICIIYLISKVVSPETLPPQFLSRISFQIKILPNLSTYNFHLYSSRELEFKELKHQAQ
jgi:hypothetical protein